MAQTTKRGRGRPPGNPILDGMTASAIRELASRHHGNIAAIAEALSLTRQGLEQHLRRLGLLDQVIALRPRPHDADQRLPIVGALLLGRTLAESARLYGCGEAQFRRALRTHGLDVPAVRAAAQRMFEAAEAPQ